MSETLNESANTKQFMYHNKIYVTAKDCYDDAGVPTNKRYGRKYYTALKKSDSIVNLDDAIDNKVVHAAAEDFEITLKKIKEWYQTHDIDPDPLDKDNAEIRRFGQRIQNIRKGYKNYLLKKEGKPQNSNIIINEYQVNALNEIGFVWDKSKKKTKNESS